jgi:hypothetical protein
MPSGGSKSTFEGLKLYIIHQLLAYADEVSIAEENIDTIQKKTQKPY